MTMNDSEYTIKDEIISWLKTSWPIYIGIIILIIIWCLNKQNFEVKRIEFVLNAFITSSVTIIGFFITVISILIGVVNTDVMKFIFENRGYKLLARYFMLPIISGSFLVGYCIYLGICIGNATTLTRKNVLIGSFLITVFYMSSIQVSLVLLRLLKNISCSNRGRTNSDDVYNPPSDVYRIGD